MLPCDSAQKLYGLSIVFYRSHAVRAHATFRCIQNLNGLSIVFYRSHAVRAHATFRRIQNLNGLSIVFYRSHSGHTRRSDAYIDYRQVWGSLRLAPNKTLKVKFAFSHTNLCLRTSTRCEKNMQSNFRNNCFSSLSVCVSKNRWLPIIDPAGGKPKAG